MSLKLSLFSSIAPGALALALLALPAPGLLAQSDAASSSKKARPTAAISVSPAVVAPGKTATLSWSSNNSTTVSINGINVGTSGNYTAVPPNSMAFTMTASGPGGTSTAQTAITVQAPTPSPTPTPSSSSTAPHINYTDLNVGSNSGGDTGNGVYVRIFGSNFGASQGSSTATLGGNLVTHCGLCSWSNTQIIAQLGPAASTGNIVVSVDGASSNGIPFTVAPTTIVFVSPSGSDNNTGTYASPFQTWRAAFNSVTSGDNTSPRQNTVIYLEPGLDISKDDGRGYSATMSTDIGGSSPSSQLSIVGFPGGTVNVGSLSVDNGIHGWGKYLTLANLTIIGRNSAIDDEAGNVRIMHNDLSCPAPPQGLGGTACVLGETDNTADTWAFEGNTMHDTGGNVDKTYHAVYFSTNVNHADVGWNNIGANFKGYCRSIMFHATQGGNQSDLHVHDNFITGGYCDGIAFASADPSHGVVEAYNNVISHVAIASNPYGVANEAGIALNSDPAGSSSGTAQIYNNTIVDAGGYTQGNQNGCFGIVSAGAGLNLVNNLCVQPSASEPYLEAGSQGIAGSNNLWFGAGTQPSFDPAAIDANPLFVSTSSFALQPSSPAIGKGSSTHTSAVDILGITRQHPPTLGAFE